MKSFFGEFMSLCLVHFLKIFEYSLVHKGKHEIFSTKVYVGINTLCIDKILWTADT